MADPVRIDDLARYLEARKHHVTPDNRVKPTAAAFIIGVPQERLRKWRCDGRGPRYYKGAGPIWYSIADVLDWMEAHAVDHAA